LEEPWHLMPGFFILGPLQRKRGITEFSDFLGLAKCSDVQPFFWSQLETCKSPCRSNARLWILVGISSTYKLLTMPKKKMYLSARISEDAHAWNNEICDHLAEHFEVFKPQEHNPYNLDHRLFEKEVFRLDLEAMIASDIGILLTPYGRDCAWEVGWYARSQKPLVLFAHDDVSWTRDWMIKGGLDAIFVVQEELYNHLKEDKIVHDKVHKVESKQHLSDAIHSFLNSFVAHEHYIYERIANQVLAPQHNGAN
jgi:nucleoside 2-deoxyribosyltransferase